MSAQSAPGTRTQQLLAKSSLASTVCGPAVPPLTARPRKKPWLPNNAGAFVHAELAKAEAQLQAQLVSIQKTPASNPLGTETQKRAALIGSQSDGFASEDDDDDDDVDGGSPRPIALPTANMFDDVDDADPGNW
jgi:hypothetical protein